MSVTGLASLRRLLSGAPAPERCELCASAVAESHQHLVDPEARRLLCACDACAILFDGSGITRYRRVPRDVRKLVDLKMDDGFWGRLSIPIGLVFFFRSSASGSALSVYPSPAGPTESGVDEEAWKELTAMHPSLSGLATDVEALLVNRLRDSREYFIAPIDTCYQLTGLIRRHWRGFSGGETAWREIEGFFLELNRRSRPERMQHHA